MKPTETGRFRSVAARRPCRRLLKWRGRKAPPPQRPHRGREDNSEHWEIGRHQRVASAARTSHRRPGRGKSSRQNVLTIGRTAISRPSVAKCRRHPRGGHRQRHRGEREVNRDNGSVTVTSPPQVAIDGAHSEQHRHAAGGASGNRPRRSRGEARRGASPASLLICIWALGHYLRATAGAAR